MRQLLRALPVFAHPSPAFVVDEAPGEPVALFTECLAGAVEAGVLEPHAVTLSTVDEARRPDARVLILKDVGQAGWSFASSADSPKGRRLAANPAAALSVYWPGLGRQVRLRGRVHPATPVQCAEDYLARSPGARAEALLGRQSQVRTTPSAVDTAADEAAERVAADAGLVAPAWALYRLRAEEVEFWQAARSRRHTRLRYQRTSTGWAKELLWP